MKKLLTILMLMVMPVAASASQEVDVQALQGYDAVAYFTEGKAVKGDGNQVVYHDGKTYLFSSKEHKELFKADPNKYLPQYGGWCAFGVSKGKKFASDATAWKIVDGKLYLNLNDKVQAIWLKDTAVNIEEADTQWKDIAEKSASEL